MQQRLVDKGLPQTGKALPKHVSCCRFKNSDVFVGAHGARPDDAA